MPIACSGAPLPPPAQRRALAAQPFRPPFKEARPNSLHTPAELVIVTGSAGLSPRRCGRMSDSWSKFSDPCRTNPNSDFQMCGPRHRGCGPRHRGSCRSFIKLPASAIPAIVSRHRRRLVLSSAVSPQPNPIEQCFSRILCKSDTFSRELCDVIGSCLADFSPADCAAYLVKAVYGHLIVKCSCDLRIAAIQFISLIRSELHLTRCWQWSAAKKSDLIWSSKR
jgi:hypothetical protein